MFGLFGDPFFGYGRFPSFGFNRNDLRMLNMLQDIFEDDSDEEEQEQKNKENDKKEEVKNNKKENIKKEEKKEEKKESKIEDKNVVDSKSYQKYSQFKQNYLKGPNMIEEIRERTCDGTTGVVKETTTRRIGDQWCTIEEETNKNGEKITREKWHNVSNDDVDKFKSKWEKHKGKFGFEHLSLKGPND